MSRYFIKIAIVISLAILHGEVIPQSISIFRNKDPQKKNLSYKNYNKTSDSLKDLYRQGYELIISERWTEARDKFNRLVNEPVETRYKEMAQYWIAYTLKEEKIKEAVDAYRKFINTYPESNYFDDAVADLNEIQFEEPEPIDISVPIVRIDARGNVKPDSLSIRYRHKNRGFALYLNGVPDVYSLEKLIQLKIPDRVPAPPTHLENLIPPEMKRKLSVVIDKEDFKFDGETFYLLQKIALDKSKPEDIREAAVVTLSISDEYDPIHVATEIMINDTNKGLQFYAIENLREYTKGRDKAVKAMIKLFRELPEEREEERRMIFYSIADVGNDEAVDFLSDIVKADVKSEYFNDAVYYLGSIGTEKARNTLKKVYRLKMK